MRRSRKRASSLAHPREALQQAGELQHQGEPHDGVIEQRPDAGAVREDDVALQERALRGRDARLREQAEAGVDAVGGRIRGRQAQRRGVRLAHRAQGPRVDRHGHRTGVHAPQVAEPQRPRAELQDF